MEHKIESVDDFVGHVGLLSKKHKVPLCYKIGIEDADSKISWIVDNPDGKNSGTALILIDVLEINQTATQERYILESEADFILSHYFHVFYNDGKPHENIEALKDRNGTLIVSMTFD